jgi:hypothetical protein
MIWVLGAIVVGLAFWLGYRVGGRRRYDRDYASGYLAGSQTTAYSYMEHAGYNRTQYLRWTLRMIYDRAQKAFDMNHGHVCDYRKALQSNRDQAKNVLKETERKSA